ncbi:MAG: WhiB family transcriptional regulator [Actinobacteria bacterium]|nr:WhiB family transcriptional regulator [Actinomycetota bacterium]
MRGEKILGKTFQKYCRGQQEAIILPVLVKEVTFYLEPGSCAESDWRQRAACKEVSDPEIFFPVGTTGPAVDQAQEAKAFCHPCLVRKQCLEWALETNQDSGVWGGLSEEERKLIQRERRKLAAVRR